MVILGISGGLGHDSAACIVRDGTPLVMAEEERFIRIKRSRKTIPISAALYCLQEAGIDIDDVDYVATAWDATLDERTSYLQEAVSAFKYHQVFRNSKTPPFISIEHHLAHAAASYYSSGFHDAIILIADGQGEKISTTIAYGKGREIKILETFDVSQSLGYFYSSVTHYIGLGSGGAGKTMGLAPYGRPVYTIPGIQKTTSGYDLGIKPPIDLPPGDWHNSIRSQWIDRFSNAFGPRNPIKYHLNPARGDVKSIVGFDERMQGIAASAQQTLESLLLHLVDIAVRNTGSRNLVLGGGVALNCTANGVISRSGLIDKLYVFPAAHDGGGALGAALELAVQHGEPLCPHIDHAYWGPQFSEPHIDEVIKRVGLDATYYDNIGDKAADLLCRGAVIGWMQGRMEFGPRALGHRSILADPTNPESLPRVNSIKGREMWRPLAPSLLDEDMTSLVENPAASPFMLRAFQVRQEAHSLIPAVTHVDGSTRPQTLTASTATAYHDLLKSMKQRNGIGAVLNTSFNDANEPIVCTPLDAIRTFYSTGLDALIMGNFLILKSTSKYSTA